MDQLNKERTATSNDFLENIVAQTGEVFVNIKELASAIAEMGNNFMENGYDVIHILPINSGHYGYRRGSSELGGYGFGYSVTDGVIITGKLMQSGN